MPFRRSRSRAPENDPVASPGARMNNGVPVSIRTASCEVAIAGLAYSVCEASAAGS
jgi:hypothetical protein